MLTRQKQYANKYISRCTLYIFKLVAQVLFNLIKQYLNNLYFTKRKASYITSHLFGCNMVAD